MLVDPRRAVGGHLPSCCSWKPLKSGSLCRGAGRAVYRLPLSALIFAIHTARVLRCTIYVSEGILAHLSTPPTRTDPLILLVLRIVDPICLSVSCRWTQNGAWPRLVSQRRGRTMMEAGDCVNDVSTQSFTIGGGGGGGAEFRTAKV